MGEQIGGESGERVQRRRMGWDPKAHLARLHSALPEDGAIVPMAELAKAMGCKDGNSVVTPLMALCWAILGVRVHRKPNGEYLGVSRYRDWSRGAEANAALANELGYHGAAATPAASSAPPTPPTEASQNRPDYSRD